MDPHPSPVLDVVVATDGSADADVAVDWAAREAMRRSGSLRVLTASAEPGGLSASAAAQIATLAADRARRQVPGLLVEADAVDGDPRDMLEKHQDGAALVVLGSRGLNALRTVWLGSVSYWATRHLRVPAVIVRPLPGRPREVRRIAVGVDSPAAGPTLRAAFEMAAHHGCPVVVAHAWWDLAGSASWSAVAPAEVDPSRRQLVEDLVSGLIGEFPDVAYEVSFARGSVVAFLIDLARSHDALFIGRRLTAPFDAAGLGTVATAVVEHARGVIVVVPAASELTETEG